MLTDIQLDAAIKLLKPLSRRIDILEAAKKATGVERGRLIADFRAGLKETIRMEEHYTKDGILPECLRIIERGLYLSW